MTTSDKPAGRHVDEEIAECAADAIRREADVRDDRITLTVEDGWITLRGRAENVVQRSMAEVTARYAPGVRGVTNLLEVAERRARDGGRMRGHRGCGRTQTEERGAR